MFCSKCGQPIGEQQKFCMKCGAKNFYAFLSDQPDVPVPPPAPPAADPDAPAPSPDGAAAFSAPEAAAGFAAAEALNEAQTEEPEVQPQEEPAVQTEEPVADEPAAQTEEPVAKESDAQPEEPEAQPEEPEAQPVEPEAQPEDAVAEEPEPQAEPEPDAQEENADEGKTMIVLPPRDDDEKTVSFDYFAETAPDATEEQPQDSIRQEEPAEARQEAQQEQNAPAAPPAKKKAPKKRGGGIAFLSVLLTILFLFSFFTAAIVTFVRCSLDEHRLEQWCEKQTVGDVDMISIDQGGHVLLADIVKEQLSTEYYTLSTTDAQNLLNKRVVKDGLTRAALTYRAIFLDGDTSSGVTVKKIADYFIEKKEVIEQSIKDAGMIPSQINITFDRPTLEKNLEEHVGDALTVDTMFGGQGSVIAVSFMLSKVFMIIAWSVCGLLCALLILLNRHDLRPVLMHIAVPMLLVGIFFVIVRLLLAIALPILNLGLVTTLFASLFQTPLMIAVAVCLGTFFLLFILYFIWGVIRTPRADKSAKKSKEESKPEKAG